MCDYFGFGRIELTGEMVKESFATTSTSFLKSAVINSHHVYYSIVAHRIP